MKIESTGDYSHDNPPTDGPFAAHDETYSRPFGYVEGNMYTGRMGEYHTEMFYNNHIWGMDQANDWDSPSFGRFTDSGDLFLFGHPEPEDFEWVRDQLKLPEATSSKIDHLISSFMEHQIEHVMGPFSVQEMRDPIKAAGLCHYLSTAFQKHAEQAGFKAWLPNRNERTADGFGYIDREIPGHDVHYWTHIATDDGIYGIDWTAAQYGYSEFPMIQKLDGQWKRQSSPAGEGENSGFLIEPHEDLYLCLWDEKDKMKPDVKEKLMRYLLDVLETQFEKPHEWLKFTAFGSGCSYNWDENGDFDVHVWVDSDKFNDLHPAIPKTSDELLVALRTIIVPINSIPLYTLGISTDTCSGAMQVQYYPLAGHGTKEECLSTKPYALYDMETDEWWLHPEPIYPKFYGEWFLLVEPKARLIAEQATSLLDSFDLNEVDTGFWLQLYKKYNDEKYLDRAEESRNAAEMTWNSIRDLWHQLFKSRQEAYSPEGGGLNDERDMVNKILEVWGVGTRLKERAYTKLDLPTLAKTADWNDIMDKARRYYQEGRVQVSLNTQNHSVATVYGDTGTYQTELWRDDPNSDAITLWNCTCPWGEVSWGRTRKWKKYEGRPCAHATALQWKSKSMPIQGEPGEQEQLNLPGMSPYAPVQPIDPSQLPEPPQQRNLAEPVPVPGGPNMVDQAIQNQQPPPQMPPPTTVPIAPPPPPPRPPSRLTQPGEGGQLTLPGAFTHVISEWIKESWFDNGDVVRTKQAIWGQDDRGTDYIVPRGMAGEVLWSDAEETIAIFSINSGPLGPFNVRVTDDTDLFYEDPKASPGMKRRTHETYA